MSEPGAPGGRRRSPVSGGGKVCRGKPARPLPGARAGRRAIPAPDSHIREAYYCRGDLCHPQLLQENTLLSVCPQCGGMPFGKDGPS